MLSANLTKNSKAFPYPLNRISIDKIYIKKFLRNNKSKLVSFKERNYYNVKIIDKSA